MNTKNPVAEALAEAEDLLIAARTLQKERADIGMDVPNLITAVHLVREKAGAPERPKTVPMWERNPVVPAAVERVIAAAIEAGKLTEDHRVWATGYASQDLAGFNAFIEVAPILDDGIRLAAANQRINPTELAAAASAYQQEQAAAGIQIDYVEAVLEVRQHPPFAS